MKNSKVIFERECANICVNQLRKWRKIDKFYLRQKWK